MSTGTRHTVTAFDDDMDEIRGLIAEMGARAESAVIAAMRRWPSVIWSSQPLRAPKTS